MNILSFKHKGLQELFVKGKSAKIGARYCKNALLILDHMEYATSLDDFQGVKNFHSLTGNRKGQYSMHVNGNYCITFYIEGDDIVEINFEDYHGE